MNTELGVQRAELPAHYNRNMLRSVKFSGARDAYHFHPYLGTPPILLAIEQGGMVNNRALQTRSAAASRDEEQASWRANRGRLMRAVAVVATVLGAGCVTHSTYPPDLPVPSLISAMNSGPARTTAWNREREGEFLHRWMSSIDPIIDSCRRLSGIGSVTSSPITFFDRASGRSYSTSLPSRVDCVVERPTEREMLWRVNIQHIRYSFESSSTNLVAFITVKSQFSLVSADEAAAADHRAADAAAAAQAAAEAAAAEQARRESQRLALEWVERRERIAVFQSGGMKAGDRCASRALGFSITCLVVEVKPPLALVQVESAPMATSVQGQTRWINIKELQPL